MILNEKIFTCTKSKIITTFLGFICFVGIVLTYVNYGFWYTYSPEPFFFRHEDGSGVEVDFGAFSIAIIIVSSVEVVLGIITLVVRNKCRSKCATKVLFWFTVIIAFVIFILQDMTVSIVPVKECLQNSKNYTSLIDECIKPRSRTALLIPFFFITHLFFIVAFVMNDYGDSQELKQTTQEQTTNLSEGKYQRDENSSNEIPQNYYNQYY